MPQFYQHQIHHWIDLFVKKKTKRGNKESHFSIPNNHALTLTLGQHLSIHVVCESIDVWRHFVWIFASVILEGPFIIDAFDLLEWIHRDQHMTNVSLQFHRVNTKSEQQGAWRNTHIDYIRFVALLKVFNNAVFCNLWKQSHIIETMLTREASLERKGLEIKSKQTVCHYSIPSPATLSSCTQAAAAQSTNLPSFRWFLFDCSSSSRADQRLVATRPAAARLSIALYY